MAMRANPGKFDNALDEAVWSLSLDGGPDEEAGSSSEAPGTWAGLMRDGREMCAAIKADRSGFPHVTASDLEHLLNEGAAGAIITESSSGLVSVKYYAREKDLERDWKECEEELGGDDDEDMEPNAALSGPKIKRALAYVHHWNSRERQAGQRSRSQAASEAIRAEGLSEDEADVLLRAIHVDRSELKKHRPNTSIADRRKAGIIEGLTRAEMDAMEIRIPTFDWKQVGGDMNPGAHGGIIAEADGDSIRIVEIQPVTSLVGEDEAKDVGFPFWTKEGSYDLSDLSLSDPGVQSAIESSGLGEHLVEMTPEDRAVAIAEACLTSGHRSEEGPAGWSKDIYGKVSVKWASGTTDTIASYLADEDDEFKRQVLGWTFNVMVDDASEGIFPTLEAAIAEAETFEDDQKVEVVDDETEEVVWDNASAGKHTPNTRLRRDKIDLVLRRVRSASENVRRPGNATTRALALEMADKEGLTPDERGVVLSALSIESQRPPQHHNPAGFTSVDQIKRANKAIGNHFFDKDTLRFFDSKIEPRIYAGRYFITSEQFDDSGPRLYSVREAEESGRVKTQASRLKSKTEAEDTINALLRSHVANTKRPTLERDGVLDQLIEIAAESMEPDGRGRVPREVKNKLEVTEALRRAVSEYEAALEWALDEVVMRYPPLDGATSADLYADNAPYLVLMTLRGEGRGIWDGSWDAHYDSEQIKKVKDLLKRKLSMYATDANTGKVEEELMNAVYEAMREAGYGFDEHTYVPLDEGGELDVDFEKNASGYTMQSRSLSRIETYPTIQDAIDAGVATGVPFDVSAPAGNIVWAWEQRGNERFEKNAAGDARWHVFLNGELLEPVYMDPKLSAEEVRQKLIAAGYDKRIRVDQPPARRTNIPPHYASGTHTRTRMSANRSHRPPRSRR
jgi:hypothetical protein